jgi:hypothetical protein
MLTIMKLRRDVFMAGKFLVVGTGERPDCDRASASPNDTPPARPVLERSFAISGEPLPRLFDSARTQAFFARAVNEVSNRRPIRARTPGGALSPRRTNVAEMDWLMAGMDLVALVGATLFMSVLSRRSLSAAAVDGR